MAHPIVDAFLPGVTRSPLHNVPFTPFHAATRASLVAAWNEFLSRLRSAGRGSPAAVRAAVTFPRPAHFRGSCARPGARYWRPGSPGIESEPRWFPSARFQSPVPVLADGARDDNCYWALSGCCCFVHGSSHDILGGLICPHDLVVRSSLAPSPHGQCSNPWLISLCRGQIAHRVLSRELGP